MKPRHRGSSPQLGPSPYAVIVSNNSYTPGENLTVTISGSTAFKGYMLQVQSSNSPIAWPVGEFIQIPDGKWLLNCLSQLAVKLNVSVLCCLIFDLHDQNNTIADI